MSSISINNNPIRLTQADSQFIESINNRITMFGQIPYTVPQPLIIEMIKEGARYFYRYYWKSGTEVWGVLRRNEIYRYWSTNGTKHDARPILSYHVKLPPSVKYVREIYERGNNNINWDMVSGFASGNSTGSMRVSSQYSSRMSGSNQLFGINNDLYIMESVVKIAENNAFQSCCTTMVPYDFDPLTKDLFIHKELRTDFVLSYCRNVDLQYLYQDDLFINYIEAKCLSRLKRLIGGHTIDLPGGVSLNVDTIIGSAEDDVKSIEEQVKAGGGIGDVILWRQ
jgi:hypothetical protein